MRVVSLVSIYLKGLNTGVQIKTSTWMFTAAVITKVKKWTQSNTCQQING